MNKVSVSIKASVLAPTYFNFGWYKLSKYALVKNSCPKGYPRKAVLAY